MENPIKDIKPIFVIDVLQCDLGEKVTITGIITKRKPFQNGIIGVWLKDITGNILCLVDPVSDPISQRFSQKETWTNTRLRISGILGVNSRNIRVLKDIISIEVLLSPSAKLSELDYEMRDKASRMLMSRICRLTSDYLRLHHFTEFESRVISNKWNYDSLEPLLVSYPGFGSPATLIISPAAQVVEFLTTTLIPRAFTISTSFVSSYRFPNGAAETTVIVAKATDLTLEEQVQLLKDISNKLIKQFYKEEKEIQSYLGVWPNIIDGESYSNKKFQDDLNIVKFSTDIPVIGENWKTNIVTIIQLLDREKNIIAEGAMENLGENVKISSLTIYPSQFLGLIEKAPRRQLQNLMRPYDGKR